MSGALAGVQLGPYRLDAPIGAGGMGEVYRGTDTRLGRQVAIKILPAAWAADPERRARFEREAHAIAALNHPHICTIHDVGRERDVDYMVMELIDGQTLADAIGRQPMALDRALAYAIAVADALDAAHRHGIVHRDLKPANVMIVKAKSGAVSGQAKLLDFGLAQIAAAAAGATAADVTGTGVILGTPQYMSPEQIDGRPADARTDIFAFGALLYEMLTGRPPFDGSGSPALMAAILRSDPAPIETVRPAVPAALAWLIRICLAKSPDERFASMHDILLHLRRIAAEPESAQGQGASRRRGLAIALAVIGIVAVAVLSIVMARRETRSSAPPVSFTIAPPPGTRFPRGAVQMALAPTGDRIVFVANSPDGVSHLWLRRFDAVEPQLLEGTDGAAYPFWSADGRAVAFYAGSALKRIDSTGGAVQTIAEGAVARGGAWGPDGTIIFGGAGGLARVAETGGTVTPVAASDAARGLGRPVWPTFLPDGRRFLYSVQDSSALAVYQGSLESPAPARRMFSADSNVVISGSSLFSISRRSLISQTYDADRGVITGQPVTIASGLTFDNPARSGGAFAVGADGTIAYRSASPDSRLVWFTRAGARSEAFPDAADYHNPSLSPDGTRVAIEKTDPATREHTIWKLDLARGTTSRLVFDQGGAHEPIWSPDGARVIFSTSRHGSLDFYWIAADGSGKDEPVGDPAARSAREIATDWSSDGQFLAYEMDGVGKRGLWILPIAPLRAPSRFFESAARVGDGAFSPDRHWLAYTSDEAGAPQVYVRRFPESDRPWQVSTRGGIQPRWSHDGSQLFFLGGDGNGTMMSADIRINAGTFQTGPPVALFDTGLRSSSSDRTLYCVTPEGRFLVNLSVEDDSSAPITVLLHWKPPAR